MSAAYIVPVDPAELSTRVSYDPRSEEGWLWDLEEGTDQEEPSEEAFEELANLMSSDTYHSKIEPLFEYLPSMEADFLSCYFIMRKKQADIAEMWGVTQAAVSYRLVRAIQRLKFLLSIPEVSQEDMERDLATLFNDPVDVQVLVGMWKTTCQSEVASRLNLTQGKVRHRFFRAVKALEMASAHDEVYRPYSRIFDAISKKRFNILREVQLPQWQNRVKNECA